MLKNQIISGCTKSYEKPIKYKSRKRQTWCNSGMIKQYLPILHIQNCLPTINEISPEKTYKKNVQSIDIVDQSKFIIIYCTIYLSYYFFLLKNLYFLFLYF